MYSSCSLLLRSNLSEYTLCCAQWSRFERLLRLWRSAPSGAARFILVKKD